MRNYNKFYLCVLLCGSIGVRILCLESSLKTYAQHRQNNCSFWDGGTRILIPTLGALGYAGLLLAAFDRSYRASPVCALSGVCASFSTCGLLKSTYDLMGSLQTAYTHDQANLNEEPGSVPVVKNRPSFWNALCITTRHFAGSASLDKAYREYIESQNRLPVMSATPCPKEHTELEQNLRALRENYDRLNRNYLELVKQTRMPEGQNAHASINATQLQLEYEKQILDQRNTISELSSEQVLNNQKLLRINNAFKKLQMKNIDLEQQIGRQDLQLVEYDFIKKELLRLKTINLEIELESKKINAQKQKLEAEIIVLKKKVSGFEQMKSNASSSYSSRNYSSKPTCVHCAEYPCRCNERGSSSWFSFLSPLLTTVKTNCARCSADNSGMHPMNAQHIGPCTCPKQLPTVPQSTDCPYAQAAGVHDMMRQHYECTCGKCNK